MEPKCSVHQDSEARAVCLEKKELLCFSCALNRAKSEKLDNIQEIDKISDGKERILLEYLVLNQIASKKEKHFVEYERKVEEVKEKLEDEVNTAYKELAEKINDLKENSLRSIQTQASIFLTQFKREKNEFEALQKEMKGNIEKMLVAQSSDIDSCKSQLENVRTKITDEIIEFDSNPDGNFTLHKPLQDVTYKLEDGLGKVSIFKLDHYSLLNQDETNDTDEEYLTPTANSKKMAPKPPKPTRPPKPVVASSKKKSEKPKPLFRSTSKTDQISLNAGNADETTTSNVNTTSSKTESDSKNESKVEKSRKPMFGGIFRTKEKGKSDENEGVYVDVSFVHKDGIQAKHLINRTRSVSGLESANKAPFQISKIVAVGEDRVGLLSSSHSLVAVTLLDGTVLCSKTYQNRETSIVATGNNLLAVLSLNERAQIQIVDVSGSQIEEKGTIDIQFELSDITGFDYSSPKSYFAIGTKSKYVIIDTKGKKVKSTDIGNVAGSSDIATTYDFEKKRYFVLNKEQKTLKCVAFKSLECIWKSKYGDEQFNPKAIYLYKDELCVTSSHKITIFSAKDGKAKRQHDTSNLLDACLGICVIDDVLVISSNSENFGESAKLCFIGI